jgi:hypothetical protein
LEEDRDFRAEIKPANLKQVIKAACNRLRPAGLHWPEQNSVINGIPRGIDSVGCLPRAAGKTAKVLLDVDRWTFANNLREEAVKFDRVMRRPAQRFGKTGHINVDFALRHHGPFRLMIVQQQYVQPFSFSHLPCQGGTGVARPWWAASWRGPG